MWKRLSGMQIYVDIKTLFCPFSVLSAAIHEVSDNTRARNLPTLNALSGVSFYGRVRSERSRYSSEEFEMDSADVTACSVEDRNIGEERVQRGLEGHVCPHWGRFELTVPRVFSDYKNNLLKAKASLNSPPKVIDLDKGSSHHFVSTFTLVGHPLMPITEVYV